MAVGLGLMMGFRFTENFKYPYISRSITEFWRRWHISLSSWLRDYLYIPLGGNRKGVARTYINLFLTMLLGGIWHGANWTFVIWGAWHGGLLAAERAAGIKGNEKRPIWAWAGTLLAVLIGWVLFRAVDLSSAIDMYSGMLGLHGFAIRDLYAWQVSGLSLLGIALGIAVCAVEPWFDPQAPATSPQPFLTRRVAYLAIGKLVAESDSPFLYFQF
jgi:alginate O-acetyltransferase complex protein AlgI